MAYARSFMLREHKEELMKQNGENMIGHDGRVMHDYFMRRKELLKTKQVQIDF